MGSLLLIPKRWPLKGGQGHHIWSQTSSITLTCHLLESLILSSTPDPLHKKHREWGPALYIFTSPAGNPNALMCKAHPAKGLLGGEAGKRCREGTKEKRQVPGAPKPRAALRCLSPGGGQNSEAAGGRNPSPAHLPGLHHLGQAKGPRRLEKCPGSLPEAAPPLTPEACQVSLCPQPFAFPASQASLLGFSLKDHWLLCFILS